MEKTPLRKLGLLLLAAMLVYCGGAVDDSNSKLDGGGSPGAAPSCDGSKPPPRPTFDDARLEELPICRQSEATREYECNRGRRIVFSTNSGCRCYSGDPCDFATCPAGMACFVNGFTNGIHCRCAP